MTILAWVAVAVSGWLVVSGLVGVVVGRMVRRRDEQQPVGDEPAVTDQSRWATNTR